MNSLGHSNGIDGAITSLALSIYTSFGGHFIRLKKRSSDMITIEDIDAYSQEVRRAQAYDIKQRCKETGNCDTCRDKERGQPCPYAGNPVNWKW